MKLCLLILAIMGTGLQVCHAQPSHPAHGFSTFDTLKYPAGFTHFDYANPDAPKGGTLRRATMGTFDSLNPYIVKGNPAGMITLTTATLLEEAGDRAGECYAYGAESVELAPDRSWVIFRLNPKAVFSNGEPVTADDIIWVFDILRTKGIPLYRTYYKNITRVEKLDAQTVKFFFDTTTNPELTLVLGQLPLLSKKYYMTHAFDKTSLAPPPCSGPYVVDSLSPGRSITYRRVENWWGAPVPSQKGRYNFDYIKLDYYLESNALFEGFKAGQYDFRVENISENWARNYTFPAVKQGLVTREETSYPSGTYGLFFNTRRPVFSDRRVRKAITLLLNFPWMNKHLFYGLYKRNKSYYPNSDFEARGLPTEAEKMLLQPFEKSLPAEVLSQEFTLPEPQAEEGQRMLQTQARALLKEAGYEIASGVMVNKKTGKPFAFTLYIDDKNTEKIALNLVASLKRLGIQLQVRNLDTAAYQVKVADLDYDMIIQTIPQGARLGNEQRDFFGSERASVPGTLNYAGIQNPVADQLIEQLINARTYKSLVACGRALDRVLLWEYYMIPAWSDGMIRLAYWNRLSHPKIFPKYRGVDITTWWYDAAKAAKIDKQGSKAVQGKASSGSSRGGWWHRIRGWFTS